MLGWYPMHPYARLAMLVHVFFYTCLHQVVAKVQNPKLATGQNLHAPALHVAWSGAKICHEQVAVYWYHLN